MTAHPAALNPTHWPTLRPAAYRRLKTDIEENGILQPLVFVEYRGHKYLVDGHHRRQIALELELEEVPVEKVDLPFGAYRSAEDLFEVFFPKR